jgi:hypothetical protein
VSDAQIFFIWSLSAGRTTLFLTGHFLCWARIFFFTCCCSTASVSAPVRSLPPLRRAQCTFFLFFFACSRSAGPVRARIFFLLCLVSRCVHADTFALSDHFPWRADKVFFACCRSARHFFLSGRFLSERTVFFLWSPVSRGVHAESFFLGAHAVSGHFSSAEHAQIFLGHFCSARALALHACQGHPFFLSSRFQQLRANLIFFCIFPLLFLVL